MFDEKGDLPARFPEKLDVTLSPQVTPDKEEVKGKSEEHALRKASETIREAQKEASQKEVPPPLLKEHISLTRDQETWIRKTDDAIAEERLQEFHSFTSDYLKKKDTLLGKPKLRLSDLKKYGVPAGVIKVLGVSNNFVRMFSDGVRLIGSKLISKETLREADIQAEIVPRNSLLEHPTFQEAIATENSYAAKNKKILAEFVDREVATEANCTNVVVVRGLSPTLHTRLISEMGEQPVTFLSDSRGENAGRVAIDNIPRGGHPFLSDQDPSYQDEMRYWMPVFFNLDERPSRSWIQPWKRWYVSRTHGVVYATKDTQGKDALFFPIHVDTKNPVMAIVEAVKGTGKGEKSALAYHQTAVANEASYVGTGLYDLGSAIFVHRLREMAHQGKIKEPKIKGEENLRTRYSIVKDDQITWKLAERVKEKGN